MRIWKALDLLELSWEQRGDRNAILKAYKSMILYFHPDKNSDPDCTAITQELNEARDMLFRELDAGSEYNKKKDEYEEKEHAKEEERIKKRRAQYSKPRNKRAPDSRIHRKLDSHPEGKKLIEEMTTFFKTNFEASTAWEDHVYVSQLPEIFAQSRKQTSQLDNALFQRHYKKILATIFPSARNAKHQGKRCYAYLKVKKT